MRKARITDRWFGLCFAVRRMTPLLHPAPAHAAEGASDAGGANVSPTLGWHFAARERMGWLRVGAHIRY